MPRLRKNISITKKQDDAIKMYNTDHPYAEIKLSAITQEALNKILEKEGYL